MKIMTVAKFLAKACSYAQEHIDCSDAWGKDEFQREDLLQCTGYQAACFLSQNTVNGGEGVECNIIIDELVEWPMKSEEEWLKILNEKADLFGGWK